MKDNEYQCAICKKTFEKEISDEEAMKEYADFYGAAANPLTEKEMVCDDCFAEMKPWLEEQLRSKNN